MESHKIALVSDWFFPGIGGIEHHIHDLALSLMDCGNEVHVITNKADFPDEKLPYKVHRFDGSIKLSSFNVSLGYGMLKKIYELYEIEKFDITHGHSIYSPLAVSVSNLSSGICGVPSILTNHSLNEHKTTTRLIVKPSIINIDRHIAVSETVKKDMIELLGNKINKDNIHVIPNGVSPEKWHPTDDREKWKNRLGLDGLIITNTSRLVKRKRAYIIPKMAYILKNKFKIHNVKFIIIGDGKDKPRIENLINKYDVEDIVILTGRKSHEEIREYLWASDIYICPTKYEAFGLAALEALSCGIPVIANNHGGISELIEHGKNGFLSLDDNGFLNNLVCLINDDEKRMKMSEYASKSVLEKYNWKKVTKDVLDVYDLCMNDFSNKYFIRDNKYVHFFKF